MTSRIKWGGVMTSRIIDTFNFFVYIFITL